MVLDPVPLIIVAGLLYGLGLLVMSLLLLLPIKSISKKTFSFVNALKRAVTTFFVKPDFTLIILVVVVLYAISNTFLGLGHTLTDISRNMRDTAETQTQAAVVVAAAVSLFVGMVFMLVLTLPLLTLARGFILLVYKDYQRSGRIDPGLWKKIFSLKGLYLIIASLLVTIAVGIGFVLFLFPGILLSWALLYVPYLIILKDQDPVTAMLESVKRFRSRPWDTIFLSSFNTAADMLLLTSGIESALHYLVILPISTFLIADCLSGGRR